jgi:hypothetical protein
MMEIVIILTFLTFFGIIIWDLIKDKRREKKKNKKKKD